jgi:DNA-binding response OmpR family regulator
VDVHVSWLRQKLEEDPKRPRWIVTVHGMGYKFQG